MMCEANFSQKFDQKLPFESVLVEVIK